MNEQARVITFDIETRPSSNAKILEQIEAEARAKRPAGNTPKARKLSWDSSEAVEERVKEAIHKSAVNPLVAEILVVAWQEDSGPIQHVDAMRTSEGEAVSQLAERWNQVIGVDTLLVGHNVNSFDAPVLLNAWRRARVRPPAYWPAFHRGHWRGPATLFDTMTAIPTNHGLNMISLVDACAAYGIDKAKEIIWQGEPMSGGRVWEAFQAEELDLLIEYAKADVAVERRLFDVLTFNDSIHTHPRRGDLRESIAEIQGSALTDEQKLLALEALAARA